MTVGELRRSAAAVAAGEGRAAAVARARQAQRPDRLGGIARRRACARGRRRGSAAHRPATSTRTCRCPTRAGRCSRMGPGVGPAVLYWGELVVFIARGVAARALEEVAAALRRVAAARARTLDAVVVGVLAHRRVAHVMRWRESWQPAADVRALAFQRRPGAARGVHVRHHLHAGVLGHSQWTAVAQPDMDVAGSGSATAAIAWFQDQTAGVARGAGASISVPMWVYRALFFAWADVDGVRAGGLAALGVQRVEDERPVAHG